MKKLLVVSDTHSGHVVGLTPPAFNPRYDEPALAALSKLRDKLYGWTMHEIHKIGKVDLTVFNGDGIEGKGERSGSTELIEPDRNEQAKMCAHFLSSVNTNNMLMTYGTASHTGVQEDVEDVIANLVGCDIAATQDVEINGKVFNFRHHVGSSTVPYGRATQVKKERLWNQLWAERGEYPKADVIIRSHVHYFDYSGNADYLAMTTPALQGYGSKYGARRCSGTIDFGFVHFEISENGDIAWFPHILRMDYKPAQIF